MMKKLFLIPSLLFLIFNSCSEEFNPKTDFEQQYALYSIISGDTTYQTAIISKSYNVPGFDPAEYNGNPYVTGAEVTIRYDGKEYKLKDTLISSQTNNFPSNIYFTNNFRPAAFKNMSIEARLPDGTILTANTQTPKSANLTFSRNGFDSDSFIEEKSEGLFFIWNILDSGNDEMMYLPSLKISYVIKTGNTQTLKHVFVPIKYFQNGNEYIPQYPQLSAYQELSFSMDVVDRTMSSIGENIVDKSTIYINDAEFELLILDPNLAPYYQTVDAFLDGYTVLLDQIDYTNVNGGRGVFGSFFRRTKDLSISAEYIFSFGYRVYR